MNDYKINEDRLIGNFLEMTAFDSETYHEREIADYLKKELTDLGFEVSEDKVGELFSKEIPGYPEEPTGNLYGFLKGNKSGEPILLSSHMDTVRPGVGKKAILHEDGRITSDGNTVLGSDDLTGLAGILEAVRVLKEQKLSFPDIEVLFCAAEESYGEGSRRIDYSRILSRTAYCLDLSGAPGTAAIAAPTILSFEIRITGTASHAGFNPELGVNAIAIAAAAIAQIPQGWVDGETNENFGTIQGGRQGNIVSSECMIHGEVRSLSDEKAVSRWELIKSTFEEQAAQFGGSCEFSMKRMVTAYRIEEDEPVVVRFQKACRSLGLEGKTQITLGGADNNHFVQNGIRGIVLSCGMNEVHTTMEYTTKQQLVQCAKLVLALLTE